MLKLADVAELQELSFIFEGVLLEKVNVPPVADPPHDKHAELQEG